MPGSTWPLAHWGALGELLPALGPTTFSCKADTRTLSGPGEQEVMCSPSSSPNSGHNPACFEGWTGIPEVQATSVESDEILPPENLLAPESPWSKALLRSLALGDLQCWEGLCSQRAHPCPRGPVLPFFLHDPGLGSKERGLCQQRWESMLHKLGSLPMPSMAYMTRVTPTQCVTAPCHGISPLLLATPLHPAVPGGVC